MSFITCSVICLRQPKSLAMSPTPEEQVRVTFISKQDLTLQSDMKNYFSPISLSSFLLKALERVVKHHIRMGCCWQILSTGNCMPTSQGNQSRVLYIIWFTPLFVTLMIH